MLKKIVIYIGIIFLIFILSTFLVNIEKIYPQKKLEGCYNNVSFNGEDELLVQNDIPHTNTGVVNSFEYLKAISFFKNLRSKNIRIIKNDFDGSLYARFDIYPELNPFTDSKYKILIDTIKEDYKLDSTLFQKLPSKARIGVLAHELSHIDSYTKMSLYSKISMAIQYITLPSIKQYIENTTEINTIKSGAGLYLKEWSKFQYHIKIAEGKSNLYFSPSKIDSIVTLCSCDLNPNLQPFHH